MRLAGDMGSIPGQEDPLEKEMATHSNILAWEIPWTEDTTSVSCPKEYFDYSFTSCTLRVRIP